MYASTNSILLPHANVNIFFSIEVIKTVFTRKIFLVDSSLCKFIILKPKSWKLLCSVFLVNFHCCWRIGFYIDIILVIYVALASASKCNPNCVKIYDPVCGGPEGGPYATFGNSCEYDFANCANGNGKMICIFQPTTVSSKN